MPLSVLGPHILVGAVVLGCFWGALLCRKGSPRHKAFGRAYLLLLTPVLVSVVPITLYFANRADAARVFQLGYLALVVTTAAWTAWRAMRDRGTPERFRGPVFKTLAALMFISGAALLVLGIAVARPLTVGFSSLGLVFGGAMLWELRIAPAHDWWKMWHLNGVSLLFAATHASLVGIVAKNLLPTLAGETMHTVTQLGTIGFAFALRFWLARRYAQSRVAPTSPSARADAV